MQTLHAAGVTIEELKDYIKENGFSNQEEKRRKKLDKYRQSEIARQKRLQALEKARKTREAKKLEKQQEIEETTEEVFK